MKLKFKSVQLYNFMSFQDATIDLDELGFTSIKGKNNFIVDNSDSNGSGKSAIWEAVVWALTGETIRGFSDICRHDADDGCYVVLEFGIDNDSYKLIRSKNHSTYKTDLKIYINNEDKSGKGIRDSEKLLEQYLPDLTGTLLGSVIVLGQGLPQRFSKNTPSGRKKVLEDLSKSNFMIEDLKVKVARRLSELNSDKKDTDEKLIEDSTRSSMLEESIKELTNQLHTLNDISVLEDLFDLNNQMKEKYDKDLSGVENDISDLNQSIEDLTQEINLSTLNHSENIDELKEKYSLIDDLKSDIMKKNFEISQLNSKIKELDSVSDICPTCGQKLPDVHKIDTTDLKKDLEIKNDAFNELKKKESELTHEFLIEKEKIENEFNNNLDRLNKELSFQKVDLFGKSELKSELQKKIEKCRIDSISCQKDIDVFYTKKTELEENIEKKSETFNILKDKILYYHNVISDINERVNIVNSFNTSLSRDFRGILLSSVISYINSRAKIYSKSIFDTDLLTFQLDGNNLNILYNDKEYESLSGGEKQKVDVIIQLSIRDMLCQHLGFSCNILVLDEITDNLDNIGCENMLNLISSNLSDVESIYIISHRQDLNIPFDRELIVVKNEEGISSVL